MENQKPKNRLKKEKTKLFNIIGIALAIVSLLAFLTSVGILTIHNNRVDEMNENLASFIDTPLENKETLRLEILLPIGKTTDGMGTIFADESGEMWVMDNFYAEADDVFIALMNDKATNDKTDDVIVDIWLDLE